MRLLNSVCSVIASYFTNVPVHIEEVPEGFERGCFYVSLTTGSTELKNFTVYQDNPIFQIVYFGERNEADQVLAENLYEVKETLKRLFVLSMVMPVLPPVGSTEKPRYAKIESYSDELRIAEGAIYARLVLNFTEDIPKAQESYELMEDVDFVTTVKTNG